MSGIVPTTRTGLRISLADCSVGDGVRQALKIER
jgi:hypothetical protein